MSTMENKLNQQESDMEKSIQTCPLEKTRLAEYFNSQELHMLFTHSEISIYEPSKVILQQGKYPQGIYLILEGSVIVSAKILGEGTTDLETLEIGCFFGEMSCIEKVPNATSIIAINQVKCLLITNTYLELLSVYYPEIKYKLLSAISQQVCHKLKKIHDRIVNYIAKADMATISFFSEIVQSLAKPIELSLEKSEIPLKQLSIFQNFTAEEINILLERMTLLKAPKHCTLIHTGETTASCYIVIYGAVQSSIMHDNKVAKLSVIGPITLFSSISCVDKQSSFTITFTTCEEAILLKLTEADLIFFKEHHSAIWYKLFDHISRSLIALEKSVDKLDIRLKIETYNR